MNLLCGCTDGTIVLIGLECQFEPTSNNYMNYYRYFTSHTRVIKDLAWLTYPHDEKLSFASIDSDGAFNMYFSSYLDGRRIA